MEVLKVYKAVTKKNSCRAKWWGLVIQVEVLRWLRWWKKQY